MYCVNSVPANYVIPLQCDGIIMNATLKPRFTIQRQSRFAFFIIQCSSSILGAKDITLDRKKDGTYALCESLTGLAEPRTRFRCTNSYTVREIFTMSCKD
jgi:hypothetical protein